MFQLDGSDVQPPVMSVFGHIFEEALSYENSGKPSVQSAIDCIEDENAAWLKHTEYFVEGCLNVVQML